MIGLLQRVTLARVEIAGETVGEIDQGLMVLIGIEKGDTKDQADQLLKRLLTYRVFADADDKMNLSLADVKGGLLLVSQFTLVADTQKGLRPSFSSAANPQDAEALFDYLIGSAHKNYGSTGKVASGQFGADMQVNLINDGPVTFNLRILPNLS